MKTATKNDIINITNGKMTEEIIDYSENVLRRGGVILTPTDTVYGLLCLPASKEACQKVFKMKQRPISTRLPIITADKSQAERELPFVWNTAARLLAQAFWPGALTIACGIKKNDVEWLAGRVEAAVRVPDYYFVQELARRLGPLFMTSANRHGVETPHTLKGAMESLYEQPTLAIDGGVLSGAPSTLVNVNLESPVIERLGTIDSMRIERILYEAQ